MPSCCVTVVQILGTTREPTVIAVWERRRPRGYPRVPFLNGT